jgi:hypothetical protein
MAGANKIWWDTYTFACRELDECKWYQFRKKAKLFELRQTIWQLLIAINM